MRRRRRRRRRRRNEKRRRRRQWGQIQKDYMLTKIDCLARFLSPRRLSEFLYYGDMRTTEIGTEDIKHTGRKECWHGLRGLVPGSRIVDTSKG